MVRKHITINIERVHEHSDLVCKYIFKKGISKGNRCYVRNYRDGYCLKHFKLVQKIAQNINNNKYGKKGSNNNLCKNDEPNKKELFFKNISEKVKFNKLICYYNDTIYKKDIFKIKIIDNIFINKKPDPLLLCFYNDNTLFNEDIKKIKKKIKNKKKKQKLKKLKMLKKLKIKPIKLEYIDEGVNEVGIPILNKIKSPFPDDKITINNIKYKCLYYTFSRFHKEIKLYLIRLDNCIEETKIYDYYDFEKLLISIYNEDFINTYFGF